MTFVIAEKLVSTVNCEYNLNQRYKEIFVVKFADLLLFLLILLQMGQEDDPYAHVARGKLTLKKDAGIKKKKKKKDKILEQVTKTIESTETKKEETKQGATKTKAEIAFQKMQEKMVVLKWFILINMCTYCVVLISANKKDSGESFNDT